MSSMLMTVPDKLYVADWLIGEKGMRLFPSEWKEGNTISLYGCSVVIRL
jgi:hypothetical protein